MHSASQLVHWVQKKTRHINLRSYLIKNLASESQQYVQDLTTSTLHKNVKSTLYTFTTCRDQKKISVGIVLVLHSVGIHVVYNQMNVMCNGIVARRHTHECCESIENAKWMWVIN